MAKPSDTTVLLSSLISGGVAGVAVDTSLFPLDTLKTRLQTKEGFWKSGGFRNIYAGLGPAAAGSAPTAAAFFLSYEGTKLLVNKLQQKELQRYKNSTHFQDYRVHMFAASVGEVNACLIRVPVENVKQRRQAESVKYNSSITVMRNIFKLEGVKGFYRGYLTTVMREIPFSLIQFPIWEKLKSVWKKQQSHEIEAWQSAVCGSFAGGVSAVMTTPLDVAKTRIMLAKYGSNMATKQSISYALHTVMQTRGLKGLYAGVVPRTLIESIGGALFFGCYEKMKNMTSSHFQIVDR